MDGRRRSRAGLRFGLAWVGLSALAAGSPVWARAVPGGGLLTDATHGYQLEPPRFAAAEQGNQAVAMFFAPSEKGFAANLNVMVQHVAISAAGYRKLTEKQFKEAGWRIVTAKQVKSSGREALRFEYEGDFQGRHLHWLALAVMDGTRVFLLTGTALHEQFAQYRPIFERALQSFRLPPASAGAGR